ncbi:MAG: hypothetical protein OXC26_11945 [Albidovulum sp.]|nr:hypothetical protein [Albidovulum sp.]
MLEFLPRLKFSPNFQVTACRIRPFLAQNGNLEKFSEQLRGYDLKFFLEPVYIVLKRRFGNPA